MHCSADLSEEDGADEDLFDAVTDDERDSEDGVFASSTDESTTGEDWASDGSEQTETGFSSDQEGGTVDTPDDELLDPDGLVDNTLTIVVAIASGLIIGLISTIVSVALFGGVGLLVGLLVWLVGTAYISRQRTVQGALSIGAYGVAAALLSVSLIPLGPQTSVEGGLGGRLTTSMITLVFMLFPAGMAAGVGWFADRFVPEETERSIS
jgi:hypothetical protein